MITARPLQPDDVQSILTHYPRAGTLMHVTTTSGRFFLRRRNPRYAVEEAVVFDHHLMEHLAARGRPVVLACAVQEDEPTVPGVRRGPDDVVELYPAHDFTRGGDHPFRTEMLGDRRPDTYRLIASALPAEVRQNRQEAAAVS